MHELIQQVLNWYFGLLEQIGLWGVVLLMALESTIVPIPSELIVPPAAYLGHQPEGVNWVHAALVVLAGTVGSYIGSAATYGVCKAVGRPIVLRYGKYVLIGPDKLQMAEAWVQRYGAGGIFFARLLPVVRHLISIPAGIVGMDFKQFSVMTTLGAGIWCVVLTAFGLVMSDDIAAVLHGGVESEGYKLAFRKLTIVVVVAVGVLGALYVAVVKRQAKAA